MQEAQQHAFELQTLRMQVAAREAQVQDVQT